MVQAFHANIIYPNKQEQVSYVSWVIFYVNLRLLPTTKEWQQQQQNTFKTL